MPVAAITGATGFIGSVIAQQLLAEGWQVRALARSSSGQQTLRTGGINTIVSGDLNDRGALRELTSNADAVVHCAGAVRGAHYHEFESANVEGTAALLQAMPEKPLPVVLLSSLAAREPELSHYARSKRAMEALLQGEHAPASYLALRPPPIYGPGDKELMPLFRAFAKGLAPLPTPANARVSLLYVDDLANAVISWLQQDQPESGIFEIHDGQPQGYTWDEVVATAEHLLGRRIRKVHLPGAPLKLWGRANAQVSRLLGYAPMLTLGKVRELRHADWVCDNTPLQRVLDWQPDIGLSEGLRRTCGWGKPA